MLNTRFIVQGLIHRSFCYVMLKVAQSAGSLLCSFLEHEVRIIFQVNLSG